MSGPRGPAGRRARLSGIVLRRAPLLDARHHPKKGSDKQDGEKGRGPAGHRTPHRFPRRSASSGGDGVTPGALASIKPAEEASQDFTADLASLRDDVAKLNASLSNTDLDAVDNARQKISETANKAHDHVAGASTDLESTIEHKPTVAALIAMVAGMLVGLLSRGRK